MKILLIGRWGKTHALAMGLKRRSDVKLYTLMDRKNGSIVELSEDYRLIDLNDSRAIENYTLERDFDLVIVVPEMSLKTGITDTLSEKGIPVVGASRASSILESDKVFLRKLLQSHQFEEAVDFSVFHDKEEAKDYLRQNDREYAIKPAGVTEGDGVKVMGLQLESRNEALSYIDHLFNNTIGGYPYVIIEEKLKGEEFSLQAFSDGKSVVGMPAVRDYKMLEEGDKGTNTPGMGSYSDVNHMLPFLSRTTFRQATATLKRILQIMEREHGAIYKGFITGQYMLTDKGMKLLEINVRPGDAEILNIIPLLETDLTEICQAIATSKLDDLKIQYKNRATVCKYVVPPGFPTPGKKPVSVEIDRERIAELGGYLFQSCFDLEDDLYEPSPRLFAVTTLASDIYTASQKCEECLKHIRGQELVHRRDIGTKELTEKYYGNQKVIS